MRIIRDGPNGYEEYALEIGTAEAYARSYGDCIGHFVHGLRDGTPFETSLEDNLKTLCAVFAAYHSVETGQAVDLKQFRRG